MTLLCLVIWLNVCILREMHVKLRKEKQGKKSTATASSQNLDINRQSLLRTYQVC